MAVRNPECKKRTKGVTTDKASEFDLSWFHALLAPGFYTIVFFLMDFFCVTHDGLRERGTTCSLARCHCLSEVEELFGMQAVLGTSLHKPQYKFFKGHNPDISVVIPSRYLVYWIIWNALQTYKFLNEFKSSFLLLKKMSPHFEDCKYWLFD